MTASSAKAIGSRDGEVAVDALVERQRVVGGGWSIPDHRPCAKGSTWVLSSRAGSYLPPPA